MRKATKITLTLLVVLVMLAVGAAAGAWALEQYVHRQIDTSVRQAIEQNEELTVTDLQIEAGPNPIADDVILRDQIPQLQMRAKQLTFENETAILHLQDVQIDASGVQVQPPNLIDTAKVTGTMSNSDFSELVMSQGIPVQVELADGRLKVHAINKLFQMEAEATVAALPESNSAKLELAKINIDTLLGKAEITPELMEQLNIRNSYTFDLAAAVPAPFVVQDIAINNNHLDFTFRGEQVNPNELSVPAPGSAQ